MRRHFPFVVTAMLATLALVELGAAGSTITGTVTAKGVASNANVVVYLEQASGTFAPAKAVEMDQRKMQFIPHVLPIVVGTTVKYLNSDPTPHNVFSPDYEKFNLGTWPQGQSKDHTYAKCAKAPCVYAQLCRVHPEMQGFVVVLQNPFFAVTDTAGRFAIENVPPGTYTVAVWHEKLKAAPKPVTVEAGKPLTVDFTLAR